MQCLKPSQTAAMLLISRLVHGYPLYITGVVVKDKWPALVRKFSDSYEVDISPSARQWRKRKGRCSSHLIAAELPMDAAGEIYIRWILMVTESGTGKVKELEKLKDARKERIIWGDYILMYLTRPREWGGGSRWTWCLLPKIEKQEANYLHALAQAAGKNKDAKRLNRYISTLMRRPMFSCIRTQVSKMLRRAIVIWDRHAHGTPWPGPNPGNLPVMTYKRQMSLDDIEE